MPQFVYSSMDTWVSPSFLAFLNNAAMNMGVQTSIQVLFLILLGLYPGVGSIAGLHGSSSFNILSNLQTVFQSDSTSLLSHPQCVRVPVSRYSVFLFCLFFVFYGSPDNGCEMVSRWGLGLHSPTDESC